MLTIVSRLSFQLLEPKQVFLKELLGFYIWKEPSSNLGRVRGYSDSDLLKQQRKIVLSGIPVACPVGQEGFFLRA